MYLALDKDTHLIDIETPCRYKMQLIYTFRAYNYCISGVCDMTGV